MRRAIFVSPRKTPVKSGPCAHPYSGSTRAPAQGAPREYHARSSPQIRAFAVILRCAGHGRIPLRLSVAAAESGCRNWFSRTLSTPAAARICAHFPSKIYRNLSNNPVNLSEFIDIYGNYYLHFAPPAPRPGGGPIPAVSAPSAA